MNFADPRWLYWILLLPVLYVLFWQDIRVRKKELSEFATPSMWKQIIPELDWDLKLRKVRWLLVAMMFALIALSRPQFGYRDEVSRSNGMDIMVVLDVSTSMETEDMVPSRLKKAKHVIRNFAERMRGDRLGLVAFAGSAYLAVPLTGDIDYFLESLDLMNPQSVTNQGTDIAAGLEVASNALDRAAEGSTRQQTVTSRAVVLVSDGEDHEDRAIEGARQLVKKGSAFFALGVGTQKGGPIPVRDEAGNLHGYKRTRGGDTIISTFHSDALQSLAKEAGGKYWSVTEGESEVDALVQSLSGFSRGEMGEKTYRVFDERFQWPLLIAVFCLLVEMCLPSRRLKNSRGSKGISALVFLGIFGLAPGAHAGALGSYLENRKALDALKSGKTDEAVKSFDQAYQSDPDDAVNTYNQGISKLLEGKNSEAAKAFDEASRQGANQKGKEKISRDSLFNLGNALSQKKDGSQPTPEELSAASAAYLKAIEEAQKANDIPLDQDARKNLELLYRQQEQKKQQKKQEQEKDNKENQEKKDQKEDKSKENKENKENKDQKDSDQNSKKDEKDGSQGKPDEKGKGDEKKESEKDSSDGKQTQRNKPQRYRSKNLSKEDAERVMSELQGKEREVLQRLKKQKGRARSSTQEKDW